MLAYGNPWRQDDGAGLQVLNTLNRRLGLSEFSAEGEVRDKSRGTVWKGKGLEIESRFVHQLDIDLAEAVSAVDRVIFVDTHWDVSEEALRCVPVEPGCQATFTFHHVSPADLLGIAQMTYGRAPQGRLCSLKGWHFQHGSQLSPATSRNVPLLVERIWITIHLPFFQCRTLSPQKRQRGV